MMVRCGWALLITAVVGCGSTPPPEPHVPPRETPPPGPTSFLVDEQIPAVARRSPPTHPASGAPVFQHVHRGEVVDMAISDDGRLAAVVSSDGSVSLMDGARGEIRAGRRLWVRSTGDMTVRFDPTGTRLLLSTSGGENEPGSFYVWDLLTDAWTSGLQSWDLRVAALSPDGRTLATIQREYQDDYYYYQEEEEEEEPGSEGPASTFGLRDIETGHERASHVMDAFVPTGLTWSPSGAVVALFDDQEGAIQLRDGSTGELVVDIAADQEDELLWSPPVFRPNGGAMATVGSDGILRIRDPRTADIRFTVEPEEADLITFARWSDDGSRLVVVTRGHNVRILDGSTGAPVSTFALPPGTDLWALAMSPDGSLLYVVGRDDRLHRIRTDDGSDQGDLIDVEGGGILRVSRDGTTVVVASDIVLFIDLATGAERGRHEIGYGEHSVWGVSWAPDSRTLYTWGRAGVERWGVQGARSTGCAGEGRMRFAADGRARYFMSSDYDSGYCNPETGEIRSADYIPAVSGDGSVYVIEDDQGRYAVIDTDTGRTRRVLGDADAGVRLSHDGRIALLMDDDQLRVVDAHTGRARARLSPGEVLGAEVSPDAATVVVRLATRLVLYTVAGREVAAFEVPEEGTHFALSPDGASLAFNADRQVTLVATRTGQVRATLQVDATPRSVGFSRDGTVLSVVTTENRVHVFATADGAARGRVDLPIRHDLAPDGATAAACRQGQLQIVTIASGESRTLGTCATVQEPVFSPNGRYLALRDGAMTHVVRVADGEMLTLRTLRHDDGNFVLAYDRSGAFSVEEAGLPHLRVRQPGPLTTAPLVAAAGAPRDPQLFARFFGGSGR